MNRIVHDALILTGITLISGVSLGLVNNITEIPIKNAKEAATKKAYKEVFSDAADFKQLDGFEADVDAAKSKGSTYIHENGFPDDDIQNAVEALDASGNRIGYVVTVTSHKGYGGDITFSVGVKNDGTLNGYSITTISETAGLGMKSTEPKFKNQFMDKKTDKALEVVKDKPSAENEIQAISGATITSRAVTIGVNSGVAYARSLMGGDK
mgnify:CR=1 FL=1